jgi:hypothetical protein
MRIRIFDCLFTITIAANWLLTANGILVKFFLGHAESEHVHEAALREEHTAVCAFPLKTEFSMQTDGGFVIAVDCSSIHACTATADCGGQTKSRFRARSLFNFQQTKRLASDGSMARSRTLLPCQ